MLANADKSFDANETVSSDGRGSSNNSEKKAHHQKALTQTCFEYLK